MNLKSGPIDGYVFYHTKETSPFRVLEKVADLLDEGQGFSDSQTERYYNPETFKITVIVEKL